jgi:hypothetical protein
MTTFNGIDRESLASLIARLDAYAEAGIDPAFDGDLEELERQYGEIRLTFEQD